MLSANNKFIKVVLICLILREIKLHENTTKRFDFNDCNVAFLKN